VRSYSVYYNTVYGKRSFLSKESDTLRSYRVYISPVMLVYYKYEVAKNIGDTAQK